MKTAISLPDSVFYKAEQLARQLGVSRSELYKKALETFFEEQDSRQTMIDSINKVCDEVNTSFDPELAAYTKRKLAEVEWDDKPTEPKLANPSK
jgi:metal-responsive CopG/Arc/MetJ family transcriptional regulator